MQEQIKTLKSEIEAKRQAEFHLQRLNRLHIVLSKISDTIMRTQGAQELYDAVCHILVEDGLLRMVFIAELDAGAKLARSLASHGAGEECLREPTGMIPMYESLLNMDTVGTAIRTGTHDVCNDIAGDSRMKPWQEAAQKHGLFANAAFPIKLRGATVAVLVLYAGETDYFLDEEIRLMVIAATNLSFALEVLEKDRHRKHAEESLKESEALFRRMFTAAATGIATSTPQGRFLQAMAYCQMLGYTEEELQSRTFAQITHPDDIALNLKLRDEVLAGVRNSFVMEKRYLKKNGDVVWTLHSVAAEYAANGEIVKLIVVAENITKRKEAEEQLLWKTAFLEAQVNSDPDGVLVVDSNAMKILQNQRMIDVWNIPEEIAKESNDHRELEWAKRQVKNPEFFVKRVDYLYAHPEEVSHDELELIDGKFIDRYSAPVKGKDNIYYGRIWRFRDITERKHIEARFRRLVESNVQGVFFWNTKGEITGGNDAFLKLTGYTREDLEAGRINWAVMTPREYADLDQRALQEIAAAGFCMAYEKEWIRKDGLRVPILLGAATFEDNPDEGVCFVLDLTERKKLEQQYRQAQKMEAIGQLAGGIAHDFNNLLTVINGYSDVLISSLKPDDPSQRFLAFIKEAGEQSSALTNQLLAFSKNQLLSPKVLNLNEVVHKVEKMLRRIIGEDIQLFTSLHPELGSVMADQTQIEQILLNLAVNARDAMPQGGKLTIGTKHIDLDESYAKAHVDVKPGSYVMLAVTDTGLGMPQEVRQHIFEPFFTTKGLGKGTGLGLSVVHGIVKQSEGSIEVYSEPGQGTCFKIYLPQIACSLLSEAPAADMNTILRGSETILLVEDEASVREFARHVLEGYGYTVLAAGNAKEALRISEQHKATIHLLLTDVVMPGTGGRALAQQLQPSRPEMKALFMSGYTEDGVVRHGILHEQVNFLQKPYSPVALAQKVKDVLNPMLH